MYSANKSSVCCGSEAVCFASVVVVSEEGVRIYYIAKLARSYVITYITRHFLFRF